MDALAHFMRQSIKAGMLREEASMAGQSLDNYLAHFGADMPDHVRDVFAGIAERLKSAEANAEAYADTMYPKADPRFPDNKVVA